jgi:hypothetical protein
LLKDRQRLSAKMNQLRAWRDAEVSDCTPHFR